MNNFMVMAEASPGVSYSIGLVKQENKDEALWDIDIDTKRDVYLPEFSIRFTQMPPGSKMIGPISGAGDRQYPHLFTVHGHLVLLRLAIENLNDRFLMECQSYSQGLKVLLNQLAAYDAFNSDTLGNIMFITNIEWGENIALSDDMMQPIWDQMKKWVLDFYHVNVEFCAAEVHATDKETLSRIQAADFERLGDSDIYMRLI